MRFGIHTLDEFDVAGKTVLCRLDLNQPVDRATGTLLTGGLVGNIPCSDVCADPSLAGDAAKCREIAAFLAKRLMINANDVYEKLMDKEIVSRQKDGTV